LALALRDKRTSAIMNMRIADGLKESLLKYRFTPDKILACSSGELASILNVDEYIAGLILKAAKALAYQ